MNEVHEAINRLLDEVIDQAKAKRIVGLFPHERFDADAIGAALGLASVLQALGCETHVIADERPPKSLLFLPMIDDVKVVDFSDDIPQALDFAIAVDCHEADRLGKRGALFTSTKNRAAIDHHVISGMPGVLDVLNVSSSSTCELVFQMIETLEKRLGRSLFTESIAILLLAGMITDTGRFSYSNTTPTCLRQAADLIERFDVDLTNIHYELYERTSVGRLQISGDLFSTITTVANGRILLAYVTQEMLAHRGVTDEDLSYFASDMRAAENVAVAFLHIETDDGAVRVNIRSNSCFNSAAFAEKFGGGGHVRAAGMTLHNVSIKDAMERIAMEAEAMLNACERETRP